MLKEWTLPERLRDSTAMVAHLFCKFTRQIWMMIASSAFKGVEPSAVSLSDAMRCWTAASIDETLLYTTFKACNAGLQVDESAPGCQGPRSISFGDRMHLYFPNPDLHSPPRKDSDWYFFWSDSGYITEYHRMLEECPSEEDMFYLNDALATIFTHLQCLPASQKVTKKSKGHVWKIEKGFLTFTTNPKFYKIERLGKEAKRTHENLGGRGLLKSRKVFQRALCESDGFDGLASKKDEMERKKRRAQLEKLSMKTKNTRKPPQQSKMTSKPRELPELSSEEDDDLAIPLTKLIGAYSDICITNNSSDSELEDEGDDDEIEDV